MIPSCPAGTILKVAEVGGAGDSGEHGGIGYPKIDGWLVVTGT